MVQTNYVGVEVMFMQQTPPSAASAAYSGSHRLRRWSPPAAAMAACGGRSKQRLYNLPHMDLVGMVGEGLPMWGRPRGHVKGVASGSMGGYFWVNFRALRPHHLGHKDADSVLSHEAA